MNIPSTLYWYDLETFGINPKYNRIAQFAGVRTDENLNIISEPLVLYCKPADDTLPDPSACLITGITPQYASAKGVIEAEFLQTINKELSTPNTCIVGYNNIRFDDEFIRYSFYRNFIDPYEHEWRNGNSRWDLIDIVRLTGALRPQGIQWPKNMDGNTSFKLEDITKANDISHDSAHDALSDVHATIAVAKLIHSRQPKLYNYMFALRSKQRVQSLLNFANPKPVVHVSGMYGTNHGCAALVLPITTHPVNKNGIIVIDLSFDPTQILNLTVAEIKYRIFTPRDKLVEGEDRIPIKVVHINKCPVIVPANTLDEASAKRLNIDIDNCLAHFNCLVNQKQFATNVQQAFSGENYLRNDDPDCSLYDGFLSTKDKAQTNKIRNMSKEDLSSAQFEFDDTKLHEMLFRYRARNFPESLTDEETTQWDNFCVSRIIHSNDGFYNLSEYFAEIDELKRNKQFDQAQISLLDDLIEYGRKIGRVS